MKSKMTLHCCREDSTLPDVLIMDNFDPSMDDMTDLRPLYEDLSSQYEDLSSQYEDRVRSRYDDISYSFADPKESQRQVERKRKLQNRESEEMYNLYDDYFDEILRQL